MTDVEKIFIVEAQKPLLLRHTKSIITLIKDLVNIKLYKWDRHSEVLYNRQATALFSFYRWADQAKKWWFSDLRRLLKNKHRCRESMLVLRYRLYKLLSKREC